MLLHFQFVKCATLVRELQNWDGVQGTSRRHTHATWRHKRIFNSWDALVQRVPDWELEHPFGAPSPCYSPLNEPRQVTSSLYASILCLSLICFMYTDKEIAFLLRDHTIFFYILRKVGSHCDQSSSTNIQENVGFGVLFICFLLVLCYTYMKAWVQKAPTTLLWTIYDSTESCSICTSPVHHNLSLHHLNK